jgi:hypothetical protein
MLHVCLLSFRTVSLKVTCTSTFRVVAIGDPLLKPTRFRQPPVSSCVLETDVERSIPVNQCHFVTHRAVDGAARSPIVKSELAAGSRKAVPRVARWPGAQTDLVITADATSTPADIKQNLGFT